MRRAVLAAVALCLAMPLIPLSPLAASELAPSEGPAQAEITDSDKMLPLPSGTLSNHVWVWSQGKRAFYLTNPAAGSGYQQLTSLDTETGAEVANRTLTHAAYAPPSAGNNGRGYDHTVAVDEAGGRLFVATTNPNVFEVGTDSAAVSKLAGPATRAAQGQTCVMPVPVPVNLYCLTGVSILDATTLADIRHVPFRTLQADGLILAPQLVAMDYAPAVDGQPPKLHLLVQDWGAATPGGDGAGSSRYNARNMHNLTYLVQLDPESGTQDWIVRLDGCRGGVQGRNTTELQQMNAPHQAAVFRGRQAGDRAVYVACHTAVQSYTAGVVRVPLTEDGMATVTEVPAPEAVRAPDPPPIPPAGPPAFDQPVSRPLTVEGPDRVSEMLADPESGRLALQVLDGRPLAMVWYVFDTTAMQFIGTIGIGGPVGQQSFLTAMSPAGRLYTLGAERTEAGSSFAGGLFVADIRRTPVPQALAFPDLVDSYPVLGESLDAHMRFAMTPQALAGGGYRLWFPKELRAARSGYRAIEDHRPVLDAVPVDASGRTLDLVEAEGVTDRTFDGVARGYGFRALLIGGAEAALRAGQADPVGLVTQCNDPDWTNEGSFDPWHTTAFGANTAMTYLEQGVFKPGTFMPTPVDSSRPSPCRRAGLLVPAQCADASREAVFAFAGPGAPAVVDAAGARGSAEPVYVDTITTTDSSAPASRCTGEDWDALWATALFGRAPVEEPSAADSVGRLRLMAECLSGSEKTRAQSGDAVTQGFSAAVSCEDGEASGHAYARAVGIEGVTVAETLSSFRVYLDPGRGVVSRIESAARGISIGGVVRIDTVRGVAESWANGRAFNAPVPEEGDSYDPNCDLERTAGTCFRRHLFGLWTPGYQCGPCGDEQAFIDGLNAMLNPGASARLREPDQRLRIGAENGFTAAIQKAEHERFADLVLNTDLLQTVLPTLEIIRNAAPNRPASRGGPRGRQIYQFAGVEVSSSYGIACLLVYDEAANTCGLPAEAPGSIQITLADTDGKPLAGGAFEVRADVDADGVLGLKDTLLPDGACVTAEDGIGTCTFDNLQPGTYLVSQVAAPPGYAKSAEPWVSEVASGEQRTVAFTNVSNVSTIDLKATDENGAPLSGAVFAAYPDPDSDGKVAPDANPAAECTTDEQGVCTMKVPAGSYVLVQTSAPGGLEGIEPVPFTFASGGQVASVSVVNYPPMSPSQPEGAASPIYTPPVDMAPPREFIDTTYVPTPAPETPVIDEPAVSVPERIGGTVTQVIRAPGDALRLLARDPKQAVAWTAALALFVLAALAVRRRQQAVELIRQ